MIVTADGFFSEMCRNATINEPYASIVNQGNLLKGDYYACLNRLRHHHHHSSGPRRLLPPRSGSDATTTETWIEGIRAHAQLLDLPATIFLQQQMPAPVQEFPRPGL
jgi:hypothetical protein